jgi:hypothetical protein
MVDDVPIELLERRRRWIVFALCAIAVVTLVLSLLRFVPCLNDALSGKPEQIRILTETFAQQLAAETQKQSPVIMQHDELGNCQPLSAPSIPDEEVRGTLFLLTYSK